ncbi:MAG: hypothetical protein QOI77_1448 [Blastocatellia bacterium]|nr:hypothetical protein [Blastocatellia bacterium]
MEMDESLVLHIELWLKSKAANEISTVDATLYHVASKDQPNKMLQTLLSLEERNSLGFYESLLFIFYIGHRESEDILKLAHWS